MTSKRLRHLLTAIALVVSVLGQGTWALAGTTGTITGTITDSGNGAPVANVTVTVTSPSQSSSAKTDANGHFTILSLAPDTYVVSADKSGYNPVSVAGISIFSDQTQAVALRLDQELKTIAKTTSRSTGNFVKSGTTSDVYSVNARTQQAVAALGGGGNMNSAYSAIYSVPGVTGTINNYGQGQTFHIRGSTYSQIGYEFDGVPVNRAFDNYNANSLSNLGQQELQVYTGGSPAGASSQTVGGFINQVIKTGTYPGFGGVNLGLGSPTFYHNLVAEAGGASPNRMFSWYVGLGGNNQAFRTINQQNAANLGLDNGLIGAASYIPTNVDFFANGIAPCSANGSSPYLDASGNPKGTEGDPGCIMFGAPGGMNYNSFISDRESVANFHIGIPHKRDGGKDDIQLLWTSSSVLTAYAESINDFGGKAGLDTQFRGDFCGTAIAYTGRNWCDAAGNPVYEDGYIFAPGTAFGQDASTAKVVRYLYPGAPSNRLPDSAIDPNLRNTIYNDTGIVKLQYQKNISSSSYARAFAYTHYSDWMQTAPTEGTFAYGIGGGFCCSFQVSRDYEVVSHTRGAELQYANQINSTNLLTLTANYTTAKLSRFNNATPSNWKSTAATSLTDGTNCYSQTTGAIASCFSSATYGTYAHPTTSRYCQVTPTDPACTGGLPAGLPSNVTWRVTVPGERGAFNTVDPVFTSYSLTDEIRPNDKLVLNVGARLEKFQYLLAQPGPDFAFWYNAAANSYCYNLSTLQPLLGAVSPGYPPPGSPKAFNGPCPSGYAHPSASDPANTAGLVFGPGNETVLNNTVFSPRFGGTYTINPDTVLRFTLGRYAEPSKTASSQYLDKSGRNSTSLTFGQFFGYGFTTPVHNVKPQISDNVDLSLEKHLKGTDISIKASPFYRNTRDQQNSISLGPNFVADFNVGLQKSYGFEFAIQKGDVNKNGLSGQLAYTYTATRIRFKNLSNGRNSIDPINDYIIAYNRLTSACNGSTSVECVGYGKTPLPAANASSCYAANDVGAPSADTCSGAGSTGITNPYYNNAPQPLLDRNGSYDTFSDAFPYQPPDATSTVIPPHVFSGFLNYKHDRLTITPTFELNSGVAYGNPLAVVGYDPRYCAANQGTSGIANSDPNACNYLAAFPSLSTGNGYLAIPNPLTGKFDSIGQYREPWQLNLNMDVGYDVSNKVHANLVLTNLVNRCFGGSKTPWSSAFPSGNLLCGYYGNGGLFVSNFYNGSSPSDAAANGGVGLPKVMNYPYAPYSVGLPFNAYFNVQIKL